MAKVTRDSDTPGRPEFETFMRRLARAGFERAFVRTALLPEWWDETCDEDPNLLTEFEIRIARFLGLPLAHLRESGSSLAPPKTTGVQLRRVRDVDHNRLDPAIHSAMKIAQATARSLRDHVPQPDIPPRDGYEWRKLIAPDGSTISLDQILEDLWSRGIPVVPLETIPAPSFQAIACIIEGRPVILIGYKYDEPGRMAFLLAHEVGHIVVGDCNPDNLVLDGEGGIEDNSELEYRADQYARTLLVGSQQIPILKSGDFKAIAAESASLESRTGIDAGMIIATWASRTLDYEKATMALKALYLSSGARRSIGQYFAKHIAVEEATETDRDLFRCVYSQMNEYETLG